MIVSSRRPSMLVRVATGVALAGIALAALAAGRGPFFVLVVVFVLVAQGELYRAARRAGYDPATALGLVAGAVLMVGTYARGEAAGGLVLFLALVFSFLWYIGPGLPSSDGSGPGTLANIAVTILVLAYVPLLAAFAGLALARPDGRGVVVVLIGAVAVYDTLAYLGGSRFGRRRLAPSISPGKTLEGTLIATLGTLVIVTLVAPRLGPWNHGQAAVLGILICGAAPLGDLFESLLKRDLRMKDTGGLLPGHGGVLDRIDAMLFSAPATYLSLRLFGL